MKIGIITHYYHSANYGGNLQAYALCECLARMGYEAEQICYDSAKRQKRRRFAAVLSLSPYAFFIKIKGRIRRLLAKKAPPELAAQIGERIAAVSAFNQNEIPHSQAVYTEESIKEAGELYDVFITGSDQVFTRGAVCPAYLLSFLPQDGYRFSYAASMAQGAIGKAEKRMFSSALAHFQGLSVREESTLRLLSPLYEGKARLSLDPTLLLPPSAWEEKCGERLIEEKYLFCYFLGGGKKERRLSKAYAQARGLTLVTLPHLTGFRAADCGFGDKALYAVSPAALLSLIRYAEAVFTDSFHATVFSGIFQKQYFVFHRQGNREASTRLITLLSLFGHEGRFCDSKKAGRLSHLLACDEIDYKRPMPKLEAARADSEGYLLDMLKGAKERYEA